MSDLQSLERREKLTRTAGQIPLAQRQQEGLAAYQRSEQFRAQQDHRPLADRFLLQEVAERDGTEDGRYLTQVLERLCDELRVLIVRSPHTRELSLCLTKIQEAEHWAIEYGRVSNSHIVIDRRIFKVNPEEIA